MYTPRNPVPPNPAMMQVKKSGLGTTLFVAGIMLCPIILILVFYWWPDHQRQVIREAGLPATAKILDIKPTGSTYNSQPEVDLTLQVHPPQGSEFEAHTVLVINPVYLPRFQPGTTIDVIYDPKDHSKVVTKEE